MARIGGAMLALLSGASAVLFEFWIGTPGHALGLVGLGAIVGASWSDRSAARRRGARDAAALARLEHEVSETRERDTLQTALLSSLSIGIVAYRDGLAVFSNPQARSDLGTRIEHLDDLLPLTLRHAVERAADQGGVHAVRLEMDFPARTVEAHAHALAPDGVVVVRLVDITERLRTESVRRDFVAAASHELKTPAAAIQAAAETVLTAMEDDPDAVRMFSQRVVENATRLSRIVSDLLDLSRLEASRPDVADVDVGELVMDEVGLLVEPARDIQTSVERIVVRGNSSDIRLAVRNLLDNAVRYTEPGQKIWVSVTGSDSDAIVEVRDEGQGIPSAALPRVFERFYRADAARSRATGGTGLGLAIVKHVAEQHGGGVEAHSALGHGSTFRVRFPVDRNTTPELGR